MKSKTKHNTAGHPSPETLDATRREVRSLLLSSPAFRALRPEQQKDIALHTVEVASYLAEPDGIPGTELAAARAAEAKSGAGAQSDSDPYAIGLAGEGRRRGDSGQEFTAQAAREGAAVAGLLLEEVNFPEFVAGLIDGVFHSIVQSSIEQMEAYGRLVADVAKTLNQFRDENVSANQGREHLVDTFPDLFQIDVDTGDDFFGESGGPRVRLRDDADEDDALDRVNSQMTPEGGRIDSLDEETIESRLVPAARTQLATSRQQLLATMVLMGINRIIVTDGRIAAKVLYNFRAIDTFKKRESRQEFDYDESKRTYQGAGQYERDYQGGERSVSYEKGKGWESSKRNASYYSKGAYKYASQPAITMASASQAATDAALQTQASLAGSVEVNFKSETFPLERMADSFQIGMIQNAAQPSGSAAGRGVAAATEGNTETAGGSPAGT